MEVSNDVHDGRTDVHIGIVTGKAAPELTENGRQVLEELEERGYGAEPVRWDDRSVDWTRFDALVIRSCWEYHEDLEAFLDWLTAVEKAGVAIRNHPAVIRWNVHKFYLRDLESAGVPVLPTAYLEVGSQRSLSTVLDRRGWTHVVVKPAVGTSSTGVWRTSLPIEPAEEERFASELSDGDLLVQEFAPEIVDGELSLVFFEGTFSHGKRGVPADGDFRAHHSFGGSAEPHQPAAAIVEDATDALIAAGDRLSLEPDSFVYARVDGIVRDGRFRVMELELVEPYLGLDRSDGALERFVDAIASSLATGRWTPDRIGQRCGSE